MSERIVHRAGVPLLDRPAGDRRVWFLLVDRSVDRHGTIIEPGGVRLDSHRANPVFIWMHEAYVRDDGSSPPPDVVIGTVVEYDQTSERLLVCVQFDVDEMAELCYQKVLRGVLRMVSIGCAILSETKTKVDGLTVPVLAETELREVSLVIVGSNRKALRIDRAAAMTELRALERPAEPAPPLTPVDAIVADAVAASKRIERAPLVVVRVAVFSGEAMLWGRRRDDGKWTTPGGKVDLGETTEVAAARELLQEAGLVTDSSRLRLVGVETPRSDLEVRVYRLIFDTKPAVTSEGDPDREVAEWEWVPLESGRLPARVLDELHVHDDAVVSSLRLHRSVEETAARALDFFGGIYDGVDFSLGVGVDLEIAGGLGHVAKGRGGKSVDRAARRARRLLREGWSPRRVARALGHFARADKNPEVASDPPSDRTVASMLWGGNAGRSRADAVAAAMESARAAKVGTVSSVVAAAAPPATMPTPPPPTERAAGYLDEKRDAPAAAAATTETRNMAITLVKSDQCKYAFRCLIQNALDAAEMLANLMDWGAVTEDSRAEMSQLISDELDKAMVWQAAYAACFGVEAVAGSVERAVPLLKDEALRTRFGEVVRAVGKLPRTVRAVASELLGDAVAADPMRLEETLMSLSADRAILAEVRTTAAASAIELERTQIARTIAEAVEQRWITPAEEKFLRGIDPNDATNAVRADRVADLGRVQRYVDDRRKAGPVATVQRAGQLTSLDGRVVPGTVPTLPKSLLLAGMNATQLANIARSGAATEQPGKVAIRGAGTSRGAAMTSDDTVAFAQMVSRGAGVSLDKLIATTQRQDVLDMASQGRSGFSTEQAKPLPTT